MSFPPSHPPFPSQFGCSKSAKSNSAEPDLAVKSRGGFLIQLIDLLNPAEWVTFSCLGGVFS